MWKNRRTKCAAVFPVLQVGGSASHAGEAVAAIDGTVGLGLEGNLCLTAAAGADGGEVLSGATGCVLTGIAAGFAALRLILEAALCVELLLSGGENELRAAFLAN